MIYTAIAAKFSTATEASSFAEAVQEICRPFGYEVVVNNPDFDEETSPGVRSFQAKMGIDLLLVLNYPSHRRVKVSSDLIYLELGEATLPKYGGKERNFIDCILSVSQLPTPISLYWLFAIEWPKDRYVRFKTGSAEALIAYLENNGWNWAESLRDISYGYYHLDLDTPLIFQIV